MMTPWRTAETISSTIHPPLCSCQPGQLEWASRQKSSDETGAGKIGNRNWWILVEKMFLFIYALLSWTLQTLDHKQTRNIGTLYYFILHELPSCPSNVAHVQRTAATAVILASPLENIQNCSQVGLERPLTYCVIILRDASSRPNRSLTRAHDGAQQRTTPPTCSLLIPQQQPALTQSSPFGPHRTPPSPTAFTPCTSITEPTKRD